jgi:Outer membrane protein beta-barrel domain
MQIFCFQAIFLRFLSGIIIIIFFPILAQATTPYCQTTQERIQSCNCSPKSFSSWYMDMGLGWIFDSKIATGYLNNFELPPDQYNAPKIQDNTLISLSGGYVWSKPSAWLPFIHLGLEYSYFLSTHANGFIEDYSEKTDIHYKYQYNVANQLVYLRGKINLVRWQNWLPYLSVGLGNSWNRLSDHSEQAITHIDSSHKDPRFPTKITTHFSYSLDIGVDYIFTKHLWGNLGYRFDQIGPIQTGTSNIFIFEGENINTSMKTHSVIGSLRYFFS